MALPDFALTLFMLLGAFLIPFFVLYQMLRLKRRAIRITTPAAPRGIRR